MFLLQPINPVKQPNTPCQSRKTAKHNILGLCDVALSILSFVYEFDFEFLFRGRRWEKYQSEEEAALGRGKRLRKAVSYREAYTPHPSETLSE
ncbi:hypothetical protein CISIN_1g0456601mg, partial [Citrus sinensis]